MYAPKPDLARFLDEFDESLAHGRLPARGFNDPDIHAEELDRIFTRAWVYLGHESEIPARGDYVQRRIGRDVFVLTRGEDGEIRALFDACRHRGATVCRAERGNAALFRCPYHGWTYKNTGALVGAPMLKDAYGKTLDKTAMGLLAAPNVDSLHGLVFASLEPDAPTLEEYLGDMKWHLDMIFGQFEQGWEVIGEAQKVEIPANWKTASENFSGDDYHTIFLHRSTIDTKIMEGPQGGDVAEWMNLFHVQLGNGHHLAHSLEPPESPPTGFCGYPDEVMERLSPDLQGPEMYEVAERTLGFVGMVFPNFGFISFPFRHGHDEGPMPMMSIRTFEPRGPGELVLWSWVLCPKGVAEDFRRETYRTAIGTFSAGGTFEQDDSDPWSSIARSADSAFGRKVGMKMDYSMGLTDAAGSQRTEDYRCPGVARFPALEEGAQRGWHRRWLQFMRSGDYPAPMTAEEQGGKAGDAGPPDG